MFKDIEVKEAVRTVYFSDGAKASFNNVTSFNNSGSFLRLVSDEGYALVNTSNINYMLVPIEARVA
jgi:hypothetical protein